MKSEHAPPERANEVPVLPADPNSSPLDQKSIVLFDGVCSLCNSMVDFVITRDPRSRISFASLQSEVGKSLVSSQGGDPSALDTMMLFQAGKCYQRSSAALRVLGQLKWPWPIMRIFLVVPPFVRNPVYRWISKNRYSWFGRQETCRVPTPQERERFL